MEHVHCGLLLQVGKVNVIWRFAEIYFIIFICLCNVINKVTLESIVQVGEWIFYFLVALRLFGLILLIQQNGGHHYFICFGMVYTDRWYSVNVNLCCFLQLS